MPRYIDADAFIKYLRANSRICGEYFDEVERECFVLAVEGEPTVSLDEVRGKGEWIKAHDDTVWWWECSVCHEPPLQRYKCDRLSNFCPNCGAKMEVE